MQYQDYYKILGVDRNASQDEVQKTFRKLARKYHPDVSKEPNAEDKFKEINEAYEVIGDAEKRKQYDSLGANWKSGQDFRPPPGWDEMFRAGQGFGGGATGGGSAHDFSFEGNDAFSDFFQAFFGGAAGAQFGQAGMGGQRARQGQNLEVALSISLDDAFQGAKKNISFDVIETAYDGSRKKERKNYSVKIPAGTKDGSLIRLSGQGGAGVNGGKSGDLLLRIKLLPHDVYTVRDYDLHRKVAITPWEAVLGVTIDLETFSGKVSLKVPPGTQSGTKLRLRGKGLPKKMMLSGDMIVEVTLQVPRKISEREKELFEELAEVSTFSPRD